LHCILFILFSPTAAVIYASNFSRTVETAQILRQEILAALTATDTDRMLLCPSFVLLFVTVRSGCACSSDRDGRPARALFRPGTGGQIQHTLRESLGTGFSIQDYFYLFFFFVLVCNLGECTMSVAQVQMRRLSP
jgi:hypothetical protein